jgi:hypothetical protein
VSAHPEKERKSVQGSGTSSGLARSAQQITVRRDQRTPPPGQITTRKVCMMISRSKKML